MNVLLEYFDLVNVLLEYINRPFINARIMISGIMLKIIPA